MSSSNETRIKIIRFTHFNAARRLYNEAWSNEKNQEVFGKYSNLNYYGHNFDLHIEISGELDPTTGQLIPPQVLEPIIQQEIHQRFDHKNLNLDIDYFQNVNPTTENLAMYIWQILRSHISSKYDIKIKLYETERFAVEFPVA